MTRIERALEKLRRKVNGPGSTYHESVVLDVNAYEALLDVVEAASIQLKIHLNLQMKLDALADAVLGSEGGGHE